MGIKTLFLETFTWWNNQTLGTKLFTFLRGKKVGIDNENNKFYVHKKNSQKRWIIYNGLMDASRIPAEWHDWIHHRTDEIPNESDKKLNWYKIHKENVFSIPMKPNNRSLNLSNAVSIIVYESWKQHNFEGSV